MDPRQRCRRQHLRLWRRSTDSVDPSNQAGSDATGTALSATNGSLCSDASDQIADRHPQLAERTDKLQPANQKRSGCVSKT